MRHVMRTILGPIPLHVASSPAMMYSLTLKYVTRVDVGKNTHTLSVEHQTETRVIGSPDTANHLPGRFRRLGSGTSS